MAEPAPRIRRLPAIGERWPDRGRVLACDRGVAWGNRRALVFRGSGGCSMQLAHEPALVVGWLQVRPATREVEWPGGREVLQPRVMQVLVVLARAQDAVVSRDDLIATCWEGRIVS